MYTKPHILYWKWNNDLLDKEILRERTMDIINRSIFDVIYVALHSVTEENQITSNPEMVGSIREWQKNGPGFAAGYTTGVHTQKSDR